MLRLTRALPAFLLALALVIGAGGLVVAQPHAVAAPGTNGNQPDSTDVGIWYSTFWEDVRWAAGKADQSAVGYRPALRNGTFGTYDSSDAAELDYHLQAIAAAKIDFLLLDETNGGITGYYDAAPYGSWKFWQNAALLVSRIKVWNDNPANTWKLKYAFAVGTAFVYPGCPGLPCYNEYKGSALEKQAQYVLDNYYNNSAYYSGGVNPYYTLDGKPLLNNHDPAAPQQIVQEWNSLGHPTPAANAFTLRWSWAQVAPDGPQLGWHPDPNGLVPNSEIEFVSAGWKVHDGVSPGVSRQNGAYYRKVWQQVLQSPRPKIVLLQSFNDYLEDAALWWTSTINNQPGEEQWFDVDGVQHAGMYWEMTKSYIGELRSSSRPAVVVDNEMNGFSIQGGFTQYNLETAEPQPMFGGNERVAPTSANSTSTYAPDLQDPGEYAVYAWWTSNTDRATNAQFTCNTLDGSHATTVDQRNTTGGQWRYLGTFNFGAGTAGNCTISNTGANGFVIMDAMKFVPTDRGVVVDNDGAGFTITPGSSYNSTVVEPQPMYLNNERVVPNSASVTGTYRPSLPVTATYEVYAWWTSQVNRATNAQFSCTHTGGTSTQSVDQRNADTGGKWYYIGTYTFTAGASEFCTISNPGANGYVMMDAMKFVRAKPGQTTVDNEGPGFVPVGNSGINSTVPEPEPMWGGSERVVGPGSGGLRGEYHPTLTASGKYAVFVYWAGTSLRATNAPITCHTAQGTVSVALDQSDRNRSGTWAHVGTWEFSAGSSGTQFCDISDAANGIVIMDAMRWVPVE